MARSARAAGMILAALPLGDAEAGAEALLTSYVQAGISAFLFPGALLKQPARLASLVAAARRLVAAAGLGRALVALGGGGIGNGVGASFEPPPFPLGMRPLGLAALASRPAARRAGRLLGSVLAACGVDLVMAPRLDLATDPKASSGVLDGFGEDPNLAGVLAAAFVKGLASQRVAACAGRFPGLGSTCAECYDGHPFVSLPAERLESFEMRPFARVGRAGLAAVFVGRALVPALEPEHIPAARSVRVVEGRLREALGFKGIVIGDDIEGEPDPGHAAVLGALAGCDLSLAPSPEIALIAASALDGAVAAGELPAPRIVVARRRLDRFLSGRTNTLPDPFAAGAALGRALKRGELERTERDREASLSVLRDRKAFPLSQDHLLVAVFLPPLGAPDASETAEGLEALREELPGAELVGLPADPIAADAETLAGILAHSTHSAAVVLSYDAHLRPAQESLAHLIEESVGRFVVVAMRDPYDAAFFPRAAGLAAAYGFSAGGCRAVARLLLGKAEARGTSPVQVIGLEV